MKFNPFCMCCAVGKQEQNIRPFQDMDKKVEYMKKVMDRMANIAEEDCAPSVSVELKKMFRDFWEQPVEDYTSVKKEYNQLMLDMEASLEETIRNSEDPLETALLYARIGNYIDFAALPEVSKELTCMVRQLQPTETGIPIELYFFSSVKDWVPYEGIQSDVFDHVLAVIPEFGLSVFQNVSGSDLRGLKIMR